jgi:ABC-2 type transport system permease protein
MTRVRRIATTTRAGWHSFLRRRTAVFFTFFFPAILVVFFGILVGTQPTDGGLFSEPAGWYVAGYIGVVVLFTPLSRVGSEVARHREGSQFEKLATTPLRRWEWLLAQTLVYTVVIGLATLLLVGLLFAGTSLSVPVSGELLLVIPFVIVGVALFCAIGAILGSLVDSQDGVIAASNGLALPLLFLSETFIPADMLPSWLPLELSPLTYFSRGVRSVTHEPVAAGGAFFDWWPPSSPLANLAILAALALGTFILAAALLPQTD